MSVVTSPVTKNYASTWLIDSGCTSHMTSRLSDFEELDPSHKSKVKIGDSMSNHQSKINMLENTKKKVN